MTLPASGNMTAAMVNVELLRSANAPFDINEAAVRALAGRPSGAISFADFYGKAAFLGPTTTLSSSSLTASQTGAGTLGVSVTANVANGRPPLTYAWSYVSGDVPSFSASSSATTVVNSTYSGTPPAVRGGVVRCSVTDAEGRVSAATASWSYSFLAPDLSVVANPSSLSGSRTGAGSVSANAGLTIQTGTPPYTYSWAAYSGTAPTTIGSPTAATTSVARTESTGLPKTVNGVVRCTINDAAGKSAVVDVPWSYNYNNYPALTASPSAASVSQYIYGAGTIAPSVTVTPSGGSGSGYTYSWSVLSGGATLGTPSAATTTISGTQSPAAGGSQIDMAGTVRCTVNDPTSGFSTYVDIPYSYTWYGSLVISGATSASGHSYTSTAATTSANVAVGIAGGKAPYTYSWANLSGTLPAVSFGSSTAASTTISIYTGPSITATGTVRCTVTDANGAQVYRDVSYTLECLANLAAYAGANQSASRTGNGDLYFTMAASASGGKAPYSYSWGYSPYNVNWTVNVASGATGTTTLTKTQGPASDTYQPTMTVTVVDAYGAVAAASMVITATVNAPYTALDATISGTTSKSCSSTWDTEFKRGAIYCTNNFALTANPTGGTAPYSYSWSNTTAIPAGCQSISIASGKTSQTCTFAVYDTTVIQANITFTLVFQCIVTDAVGATKTVQVTVQSNHQNSIV